MVQKSNINTPIRFTTKDLELITDEGKHYEIINGELFVTKSPHWNHNKAVGRLYSALDNWTLTSGFGEAVPFPGIVFDEENAVEPDAVWIADLERLNQILDQAGHLTQAPDLVIESLSAGSKNQRRDKELKLRLYSVRGVKEYWIVDWRTEKLEVYRREEARLILVETLFAGDVLRSPQAALGFAQSPLLPEFAMPITQIFARKQTR
ncbi:Uma2 family endonuclease [Oscillatoria salina]|uniref:Uma2 family endonuclease n=1 Tax=Oscillatoria salina TaxID=331517 RepID=UPI0013BE0C4C|nr:Uma2 family endonuclease [Oscillatoria salina]MBZ8182999.1 Uma2 family endonuclease [Oscillatoria salina IIICB1]NET86640.1 Uma2 family endonuclease [Kamptonema sp. SIO1D9]